MEIQLYTLLRRVIYPMEPIKRTRIALVGCGGMAAHHMKHILRAFPDTEVAVFCEPSPRSHDAMCRLFEELDQPVPPNEPDLARLLDEYDQQLDAALIITPHAFHHDQAKACLEAGLDVLLEKPMVLNGAEARSLIETQQHARTVRANGRAPVLVVSFQGSLSPYVRTAASLLRSGELGSILSINAVVWQNWAENTVGTWRQNPAISGGGFLFDTGAHMLNTVADLAGEDFVEVAAWLANRGQPVETLGTVMARLRSGGLVTLNGCGETIPACTSEIMVFCTEGIIRTCIWGRWLEVQRRGESTLTPVEVPKSRGVWEQFLAVRSGQIPNPCPPEVGLRMANLWDAIQASAARGGAPVACGN
ncbi:MAG: Gfo/Idh/MocA family protein [Ardenticatenaceae bacterium]